MLYADTSALVRAYLNNEPDHPVLQAVLLSGAERIVSSQLARVEFARAVRSAATAERLADRQGVLDRFDSDCRDDGPIRLISFRPDIVMPRAHQLVLDHDLRTLDALHLAVALGHRDELITEVGPMAFVTRAQAQGAAARALGFEVR